MKNKISKIEIKSLWGNYDISWRLKEDVNILAGINGSGKSTILECMASIFLNKSHNTFRKNKVREINIFSSTEQIYNYEEFTGPVDRLKYINNVRRKFEEHPEDRFIGIINSILNEIKTKEIETGREIKSVNFGVETENTLNNFKENVQINIINTFDNVITFDEETFDENVRTDLDRELYLLERKYLDFQLNLSKPLQDFYKKGSKLKNNDKSLLYKIIAKYDEKYEKLNLFKNYVNELFESTGKSLDEDKNKIAFKVHKDEELGVYSLSSGEKQLLLILLTFLLQEGKPSIVFMDEPEISLHFDWQRNLIKMLRTLNPNAQLIIATHSPAMIMDGWVDKVVNIEDIKKVSGNNIN